VRRSLTLLLLAALTACGRAEQAPTATTSLPAISVAVPSAPGADWDLAIREGVLLASPPDLRPGHAAPYGATGVREVRLHSPAGAPTPLTIRLWRGDSRATLAHLTSKANASRSIALGSVPATELTSLSGRSLVRELDGTTVIEIAGPPDAFGDGAYAVAALAAALRDPESTYTPDEVAAALGSAIPLTNAHVPQPSMSQGRTMSYRIGGSDREFAMVMVFADRRARLLEDPNEGGGFGATVSWITHTEYRGLGNAAVFVGSADAAVRYRALRALDGLARRGNEAACVEDSRGAFRTFVGALGVSDFARLEARLSADANVAISDARGILPNRTLRGRAISDALGGAAARPVVGWTAMQAGDVVVDGVRLATPPGTRAQSKDGENDLAVSGRVECERGIVRFTDVTIAIGTGAAHPCPGLARQGVMTKGIPVRTATKADVLELVQRDAGAIQTLEDIAGVGQDPNPLRDPRVPRCAVSQLSYGDPVFVRRLPGTTGSWLVPVRFGEMTILTMRVGRDENGLGQVGGSQGGEQPGLDEDAARRIASAPGDPARSIELVYARPAGPGPNEQIAWRAVRSSGSVVYLFPSYPGAGPDGALFGEDQVTFP
jgi:hypothetical protein